MSELVDFLNRMLDEDEAVARAADPYWEKEWTSEESGVTVHIERHDPARVLVEVEAKRAIVALHSGGHECVGIGHIYWDDDADWTEACPTIRYVASVFADRPGFDETWRP